MIKYLSHVEIIKNNFEDLKSFPKKKKKIEKLLQSYILQIIYKTHIYDIIIDEKMKNY